MMNKVDTIKAMIIVNNMRNFCLHDNFLGFRQLRKQFDLKDAFEDEVTSGSLILTQSLSEFLSVFSI